MTDTILPTHPEYIFASPRYNISKTTPTLLIPNDFPRHDQKNGTYDKYFPCYTITEASDPTVELVKQDNSTSFLSGACNPFTFRTNVRGKRVGKKEEPNELLSNSTLEQKTVYYSEQLATKLVPGWCNIQTTLFSNPDTEEFNYIPNLLVRSLGNTTSTKINLAVKLDDTNDVTFIPSTFPVGFIAEYKDNVWVCTQETNLYPPQRVVEVTESTIGQWRLVRKDNVFNVDIFVLGSSSLNYFMEIESSSREFNPELENQDDTLVCWNVAYYHS